MDLEIGVQKTDIRRGLKSSVTECAIARRLRKMGFRCVRVTEGHIRILGGRLRLDARNKRRLRAFVTLFDLNKSLMRPTIIKARVSERLCPKALLRKAV